jgi:transcriptional regulator with XRE-family HTH domain
VYIIVKFYTMNTILLTAQRIKELRTKRQLTQEHFANSIDIPCIRTYQNIENGMVELKLSTIALICEKLNIPIHVLLNTEVSIDDFLMEEYIDKKNNAAQKKK